MADPTAPASPDPFAKYDVGSPAQAAPLVVAQPDPAPGANDNAPAATPATNNGGSDPFAKYDVGPAPSSATGAFARGAEKSILPAGGTLAGAGAGAELGGSLGTVFGPVGTVVGGIAGGIGGGIAGGQAVQQLQNWAVNKLPESRKDALGFGDREAQADEKQHPLASFLGGLLPYTLTMHPSLEFRGAAGKATKVLPEGATLLQHILASPAAAKIFGGGIMGGMEIGNEELTDKKISWPKAAVATVFGTVFSKPNGIGDVITELGAHPTRTVLGVPHPAAAPPTPPPTLAQAADHKVMGPGITESVFQGTQEQAPEAALTAQENARVEQNAIGEPPEPDLHAIARQMEPETFQKYDDLIKQRETFAAWHGEGPNSEATEKHLAATDAEIVKLQPDIAAAYRRARDTVGTGQVEAEPFPTLAHMLAAHEAGTGSVPHETNLPEVSNEAAAPAQAERDAGTVLPAVQPGGPEGVRQGLAGTGEAGTIGEPPVAAGAPVAQRTIGEQRAFIAGDVTQKLLVAGRPEEEAKAAGQLISARYVTRAGRFAGKLGTPEELYAREGAAIAGPTGRAQPPAEPPVPKAIADAKPADRASLEKLIVDNASPEEIANHPIVKSANDENRARPQTKDLPGYGTPEFRAAREFNFDGEKVTGYPAAVDRLVQGAKAFSTNGPVKNEREATIVLGPPASGKSRLSETFARDRHAAIVDSDEAKKVIPEYDGGAGTTAVHEESSDLALGEHGVLDKLMDEGANIVLPKVGHTADSIRQIVAGLKAEGYKVNLVNMNAHPEVAYRRMIRRFLKTGRVIGSDYFGAIGDRPTKTYYTLKGEGGLNETADIDVNGPPGSERLIDGQGTSLETNLRSGRDREPENPRDVEAPAAAPEITHAEPVNAALDLADHVNDLSPAEQKRELPAYSPAAETAPKGADQPAGVFMFDPAALNVDASRFQFKSGGDEYGVTGALRNVTKWDPAKAQAIIVWEANDGKLFVADGHQRAGLARRLTEKGGAKNIELPGILYREKDGISADDIRAMAAVTNIANGSGSALDGAKVLRARPDLMDGSLPLSTGKGKQAAALARLGNEPFRMVVNEVIPEHYGAVVGELIPRDASRQEAAIKAIARFDPKNADEAAVLTQRVAQAELAKAEEGKQTSMFGDLETPESTAGEEMKIVGRAIGDLKKDKALFGRVLANAERIEATGSQIERGAAASVASDSEIFAKTLTSDAYTQGPIRDELIKAARDLKNGKATVSESSARIIAALRTQAETHGADRAGAVEPGESGARENEPSLELAQTDEGLFESGAEGKPQQLIPGVKPVSQRDLIQAAANKPLAPKVGQKPVGETPEFKNWFGDSQAVDEHGEPLIVYHGSSKQFSEFKPQSAFRQDEYGHKYEVTPPAFFFGAHKDTARTYARDKAQIDQRLRGQSGGRAQTRAFYLSTKNPLDFSISPETFRQIRDEGEYFVGAHEPNPYTAQIISEITGYDPPQTWREVQTALDDPDIVARLKAEGYDGAKLAEENGAESWAVFDPEQIKSIDNKGTFDPNDPRVLHQAAQGGIKLNPNNVEGRDYIGVPGTNPVLKLFARANASTIIHESGHQFLAELMRDSQHPDAPADLKADAKTALDWLGAKSADDLTTKHHEKFARGFEQYLREGIAPSKELAGVFAKFRNWLLSIYQSIKGLGTEISPDIRNVFDRLLEMEPQRTIITPHERPPGGPLLHEIHAADAAHTEPHEAAAVFDRTRAELDRYVTEPPPDIAHEITAEVQKVETDVAAAAGGPAGTDAGTEAGAGAGGSGQVEPGGGKPGSVPQSGSVGQGRGDLGGSAGQPAAESDGVPRPDNRAKLGDHPGTALAPGPADLFGPKQSPFTDRAGNIRLDTLTDHADVAQAIRDAAAENNDFIGDRRGVITDGQRRDLADALGMDEAMLNQRQIGQAFNAEQIVKAREILIQSATAVSAAMKKAAVGTDDDVMAYAQAKDRHQLIQAQVAGITAEAGRALRAFRSIAGEESAQATDQFIKQATGKTLFQLRAEAKLGAELQTPQQVSKFMHDSTKHNFSRIVLEYWINGLISGPATHMTYMAGNTISAIMKVPESIASAAVARAASALGREGTGVHAVEAGALMRGALKGFAPAVKAGIEAARTGVTTALPGEGPAQTSLPFQPGSELAQPAHLDEAATFHDAMSAAYGLVQGMKDTVISTAALVAAGGVPGESLVGREFVPGRATPNITYRGVTVLPTGAITTLPSRGVAVIHSFFRSLVFSMEKNAIAYRQAANEGLAGTELHARVAQLRSDPSQTTMNEAASHEATEAALMGKGSELTQRLSALTNTPIFGAPLLKFIDPFVRVSGNIIDQSLIRRTPVGLLTMLGPETEIARDLTGKNGNVAQDKAIGRMMVGTALAVTFGSLAAQKMLSGSGPKDPKEARVWMMAGNQPHSIRIGDTWYQVNKLGPMGMLASISADLYDVAHEAETGDFTKAGAHLLHAITQNVLDESAMHGPAEMLKAIESPDRYGEAYVRNYLAAFVPWSVGLGQMARAQDPYQRDTRTMIDTIRNKIPGHLDSYFDHELPVRRDIWGEPLPSRTALLGAGVSSIYESQVNADPVNQAMWKLGVFPGSVNRKIRNAELTPDQYDDFQRIAGRMTKMRLDKMVISPQFQSRTPSEQHDWMMEVIKQSRSSATETMLHKYPTIAADATQAKKARKQAINDRDVE